MANDIAPRQHCACGELASKTLISNGGETVRLACGHCAESAPINVLVRPLPGMEPRGRHGKKANIHT